MWVVRTNVTFEMLQLSAPLPASKPPRHAIPSPSLLTWPPFQPQFKPPPPPLIPIPAPPSAHTPIYVLAPATTLLVPPPPPLAYPPTPTSHLRLRFQAPQPIPHLHFHLIHYRPPSPSSYLHLHILSRCSQVLQCLHLLQHVSSRFIQAGGRHLAHKQYGGGRGQACAGVTGRGRHVWCRYRCTCGPGVSCSCTGWVYEVYEYIIPQSARWSL